ncbi:MAG: hypothetical protein JNL75_06035 [Chitinophagales bacterium]|nr:hypothetical protein [Chitinophagales bacterium]
MSTRGLLGFVHKGHIRASINHFDSYLEVLGKSVAEICTIIVDWEAFIKNYEKITWVSELSEPMKYLSAKEILIEILKGKSLTLLDEKEFARDELFCEYAYLINLDDKQLEIYAANFYTDYDQFQSKLPMHLLVCYPLDSIPTRFLEKLNAEKTRVDIDWKERLRKAGIDPNKFLKDQ